MSDELEPTRLMAVLPIHPDDEALLGLSEEEALAILAEEFPGAQ